MINTGKLAGRTVFITGASRGIGKAIALKAAQDGANVVIAAKTAEPHPKLPGTIYSAAQEVEAAGGKALPCIVDVRDESQVISAVEGAVKKFGGIDILINNASAINMTGTLATDMKRYDLMHNINTRGTFLVSKVCLPYLKKSGHGHIINISPPLNLNPHWFKDHVAYTMAKYGMSMCVLGMAEEFKQDNVSVNALWPKTAIHTAAIEMLTGPESSSFSRKPEIMADAAYALLVNEARPTGKFLIDEEVLREAGVSDMTQYACDPKNIANLMPDFFLDIAPTDIMNKFGGDGESANYPKKAGEGGDGKVGKLFESIKANLSPELVSKTQATFQFELKGDEPGSWYIDLKSGSGSAGHGQMKNPDATLTMKSKDFFDMFSGKLKPAAAFMSGKLKISGNLQKAMKLEKLMGSLKSKL